MEDTGATLVAASASPVDALRALKPRSIRRPPTRPLYLALLWLVTALCVLVPLVYFGFVVGIGWLEYHYYTEWVPSLSGRGLWGRLLAWVVPGFVGGVLMLFLLKPLLAPRREPPRTMALAEGEEREFVAAVQALCAAVGIRPPSQIRFSHEANAWVQFDGGLWAWLVGRKALTVGLPLVAGMSARQLVGVLAHEFGHFAQAGAMRCARLINAVNGWLYSRAYERDEWDDRLERWSEGSEEGYVQIVLGITRLCLAATRALMRGLFQLSFRMSRRLSQQMEFDADRYEATLAGSDAFRGAALQLRAIARAAHDTQRSNIAAWRGGRLASDLPAAVALRLKRFEPREWDDIALELEGAHETHYWDSHPADQARIHNAEQLGAPGLFLDERPARELLADFPALARRVTSHYYEGLGLEYGPRNLIEPAQLWQRNRLDDALAESWQRYANGMLGDALLLSPKDGTLLTVAKFDWQGVVDELRRLGPETSGLWQRLTRRRDRADDLALWVTLIDQDVEFALPDGTRPDNATLRGEYGACMADDVPDVRLAERVLALFARRLQLGVEAMDGEARVEAEQRLALLQSLHDVAPRLRHLAQTRTTLARLSSGMSGNDNTLRQWAWQRAVGYREDIAALLTAMDAIALDQGSLAKHLREACGHLSTAGDDPFHFLRVTSPLEPAFRQLYNQTLAGLAAQAERAEQQHGICPIKLLFVSREPATA